jgi:hypothetical protein
MNFDGEGPEFELPESLNEQLEFNSYENSVGCTEEDFYDYIRLYHKLEVLSTYDSYHDCYLLTYSQRCGLKTNFIVAQIIINDYRTDYRTIKRSIIE